MKKMNNKGSGFFGYENTNKTFYYIILLVFVGIAMTIYVVALLSNYNSSVTLEDSVEADFTLSRLTNVCFAYEDSTGRINQNIIDIMKVNSANLETCFLSDFPPSFNVDLEPIEIQAFPLKHASIGGTGYSDVSFRRYVLVKTENGELLPGLITYRP